MLRRILGEVFVGVMAAGLLVAVAIPTSGALGYEPGSWIAWASVAASVVASVVVGERMNRRREARESKARESP